LCLQGA